MSCNAGPSTVEDGLIFYYDEANTEKSWKGAPTTNVVDVNLNNWSKDNTATVTDTGRLLEGRPIYSVTFPSGTLPRIRYDFSYAINETFTTSINYRFVSGQASGEAMPALYLRETGFGTSYASATFTTDTDWHYTSLSYEFLAAGTGSCMMLLYRADSGTAVDVVMEFSIAQCEKQSFATPFVDGTRSDTQALNDLTNNSTITAGSAIVYNSDNTYEHVGSDDNSAISIPLSTSFNKLTGSINMWIYPNAYASSNGLFVNRDSSVANSSDYVWLGSWSSGATLYLRFGDGAGTNDLTISSWSTVAPINTWTNVCVTWASAGTSQIFINGELNTSRSIGTLPGTSPSADGRIGLGAASSSTGSWDGKISPTAIYNRVLTNNEIKQNFEALRSRFGI